MQPYMKLALIITAIFFAVSYNFTYTTTQSIFGSIVGQTGPEYGTGNSYSNYGFLLHTVIFFAAMYFILKKQMK